MELSDAKKTHKGIRNDTKRKKKDEKKKKKKTLTVAYSIPAHNTTGKDSRSHPCSMERSSPEVLSTIFVRSSSRVTVALAVTPPHTRMICRSSF